MSHAFNPLQPEMSQGGDSVNEPILQPPVTTSCVTNTTANGTTSTPYKMGSSPIGIHTSIKKMLAAHKKKIIVISSVLGIGVLIAMYFSGVFGRPAPVPTNAVKEMEIVKTGNVDHQLKANVSFEAKFYATNVCQVGSSCFTEDCSQPGVVNGKWRSGGANFIRLEEEKIVIMQNFDGRLKISATVYHPVSEKYGWLISLNGYPWITCAYHRRQDSSIKKSRFCDSDAQAQPYRLNNKSVVKTTLTVDDENIALKKGDTIMFDVIGNNTVLVGKPTMIFDGIMP